MLDFALTIIPDHCSTIYVEVSPKLVELIHRYGRNFDYVSFAKKFTPTSLGGALHLPDLKDLFETCGKTFQQIIFLFEAAQEPKYTKFPRVSEFKKFKEKVKKFFKKF